MLESQIYTPRFLNLDEAGPIVGPIGAAAATQSQVDCAADNEIAMEVGSADKLVHAEDDANQTCVPDRVQSYSLGQLCVLLFFYIGSLAPRIFGVLICDYCL